MKGPPNRIRRAADNTFLAVVTAALATTEPPDWLWWPMNAAWMLWALCGFSCLIVAISLILHLAGEPEGESA